MLWIAFVGAVLPVLIHGDVRAGESAATDPRFEHASPLRATSTTSPHAKGLLFNFLDFTPRGTQPGLVRPLLDNQDCAGCHGGSGSHLPFPGWSGSMKANAARDPLFWAALDVANRDGVENGAPGIGDYCLRCHAPEAWFGGRVRKIFDVDPSLPVDDALVVDGTDGCKLLGKHDDADFSNDYAGVGCHQCHRVTETGPAGEASFVGNADIWIDDGDCDGAGEPCRAGPYSYPDDVPGFGTYNGPPHASRYSPLHRDSALCGSCHDVTTPMLESGPFRTLIVDNGTPAGLDTQRPFPAERTYSEWAQSDFARVLFRDGLEDGGAAVPGRRLASGAQCQHCHMPQAEPSQSDPGEQLQACIFGPPRNGNLPTHEFAGGNAWVPRILKGEFPLLNRGVAFDRTAAAAVRMLSQESALVSATAALTSGGSALTIGVRVTNLSGHKLPTGYAEGRRMWLSVEVVDAGSNVLWTNGAWDAATGDLAVDTQTRIYEIKQGIWDAATGVCRTTDAMGREAFHFVLNDCIAKDNRIPPLGFTGSADPELAAYGYSYPTEAPGSLRTVNHDLSNYSLALPVNPAFPLQVRATLRYQVASKAYIEFLRNQAIERNFPAENDLCTGEPGRPFTVGPQNVSRGAWIFQLWANPTYGRSPPVDMASGVATVPAP